MFYIDSKARRKDFGCLHHKEMINICGDGYALTSLSKTHHTYVWPRWDPINKNFTYSGICLKVIWIKKIFNCHHQVISIQWLWHAYLGPTCTLVWFSILNLQIGGVFPMGPFMAGSSSVLEKAQVLLSLFSVFLTHPCLRPPTPCTKGLGHRHKNVCETEPVPASLGLEGLHTRSCYVCRATLKSLPPAGLVSGKTACSLFREGSNLINIPWSNEKKI